MKNYLYLIIFLLSSTAYGQYNRCNYNDVLLTFRCSKFNIDPPVSFVRQNDRVCIQMISVDGSSQSLLVRNHPVFIKSRGDMSEKAGFVAKNIGDLVVSCGLSKATIKVQSAEEFNKKEDEYYRMESHLNRRNNNNSEKDYNHDIRRYGK